MAEPDVLQEIRDLLRGYIPKGYIELSALAHYLGVPESTIREWVRTKGFPFYKPGKNLQFKLTEVDQWMNRWKQKTPKL